MLPTAGEFRISSFVIRIFIMTRLHRGFMVCDPAATLAAVRELSENASRRPAPRVLKCIPVQTFVTLQPVPQWKRQLLLFQLAAEVSQTLVTRHSSPAP
jgi:hypothetical protein